MMTPSLFNDFLSLFHRQLPLLEDKPEETPENTLKALWLHASGQPVSAVVAEEMDLPALTPDQERLLEACVQRRLDGEPLAYITGRQSFYGVEFIVNEQALIPRKETELLATTADRLLQELPGEATIIDLCTGVANLSVALARNHHKARIHASDLSPEALELARENIRRHRLEPRVSTHQGDLFEPFDHPSFHEQVDLVMCNPPYISSARVPEMPGEISRHEPVLAFDGGPFGVNFVKKLIAAAPRYLKPGGWLVFEVGRGQGESLLRMMRRQKDYSEVEGVKDAQGDVRVVIARR